MAGFYDGTMVKEMLKECSKMYKFEHPNILTLSGVCLDGGPAPYIIMPFMANGSLLAYLKKNRDKFIFTTVGNEIAVSDAMYMLTSVTIGLFKLIIYNLLLVL